MNVIKGKLRPELSVPGISELVSCLGNEESLHFQLVDNDGNVVAENGACPGVAGHQCKQVRDNVVAGLLDTHQPCRATCPAGGKVTASPIMHSSAFFGGIIVCELPAARRREAQPTITGVDPLVNFLSSVVAKDSFYELEVESLANDLSLRYEELALLYEIGERIPIRAPIPTVIDCVVESIKGVVRCDVVCWVPEGGAGSTGEAEDCKVYWLQTKGADEQLERRLQEIGCKINRRVKEKKGTVTVNDLSADKELRALASGVLPGGSCAVSGYTVGVEGEHYGTLVLFKLGPGEFKSGEAMLVSSVARRSATVIRNAKLYQELNGLFLSTIRTLVRIIEGKDAYTRGHSERVSSFSLLLADLLDLPVEEKEALSWSSLLHDIGKIKVPEEILKKPGALTDEEFAIIKEHPGFGAEMLSPISQLAHCLPDIRHHHERVDGRGYPDGLMGEEIPLRAKIIAVADTFDAITSDRCYRPKFSLPKAIEIVREAAGTQLWSEAANALVENRDAFFEHVQHYVGGETATVT